jgi:succinoglycan biosynthesis protein ExoA
MTAIRRVSIIAPMWNERAHVDHFVADVAAQDFHGEIELIVADGASTDGSPELLRAAAERAGLDLTLVDNPRRIVAPGLNLCLRQAKGDLIVRLDCHARYPADYVSSCVRVSEETGAWNVGGLFEVDAVTPFARAFAAALETPFGGHNWTRRRGERHDADTVFCGAFRPIVFERVGGYDEEIAVAEVEDLNVRIRRAGGRVVYDPSITLLYSPRPDLRSLVTQYYRYGLNKVSVTAKHRRPPSGRSVAPLAFVGTLALLGAASPASATARRLLGLEAAVYGAGALVFGVAGIRKRQEEVRLLPTVVALLPAMHLAHGAGGLHGWVRELRKRLAASRSS